MDYSDFANKEFISCWIVPGGRRHSGCQGRGLCVSYIFFLYVFEQCTCTSFGKYKYLSFTYGSLIRARQKLLTENSNFLFTFHTHRRIFSKTYNQYFVENDYSI
jgi:hypothetical protein